MNNAGGRFAINSATGEITVADGSLINYEVQTSHTVTVRVTDIAGATYDENFTVNIADVNEFAVPRRWIPTQLPMQLPKTLQMERRLESSLLPAMQTVARIPSPTHWSITLVDALRSTVRRG